MSKRILLVGCGKIGSRHLQSAASLGDVSEVHVVDSNEASLEMGKSRLREVKDINRNIKFSWFRQLDNQSYGGDICIVATLSGGRCALIKEIAERLGYRKFIIEKIVTQSINEYIGLLDFCRRKDIQSWVNCQSRTYRIHKYIKSLINHSEPVILANIGGNLGLACTGLHYVDLFIFYDGAKEIKPKVTNVDDILHSSMRGKDIYDLSGIMQGYSDKGSSITISYSNLDLGPDYLSIVTPSYKFIVDNYAALTAYESSKKEDWSWRKIPIEEKYMLSLTSRNMVLDIFRSGTCELPTLTDCFPAHKYILGELLPHFNRLLGKSAEHCPVT